MDRKVKSFRLRVDLLDWLESYAQTRGSSQIAVMEAAVESFQGLARGGVPDLPPPVAGPVAVADAKQAARDEQDARAAIMWAKQQKLNERAG